MTGHDYYEADRETIADLYQLIREGKAADERDGLKKEITEDGVYWRLQK
ncbi:MAG: hypothetical protein AB3N63_04760 [Puniceicoccaceae bacterium]